MSSINRNYHFFFCMQTTAYGLRIMDWSSDVCSSNLMLGEAQPVGDRARVSKILSCAAGADARRLRAMIIELERHADDLGARSRGERGDDARIDSTRHGDDDSPVFQRHGQLKIGLGEPGGGGNRLDHGRRHLGMPVPK